MNKADRLWIKAMEWFSKYWGCHQMPERSFFVAGYQLPVCARCTGIILGEILAVIMALRFYPRFVMCIVLMIPMMIDGAVQYKTKYTSKNLRRLLTGVLFGYGFISSVFLFIRFLVV